MARTFHIAEARLTLRSDAITYVEGPKSPLEVPRGTVVIEIGLHGSQPKQVRVSEQAAPALIEALQQEIAALAEQ